MSNVVTWLDEHVFANNPEIASRNQFARQHQNDSVNDILLHSVYLTFDEVSAFLKFICSDLAINLHGNGVELGAGVGVISNALLKLFPTISSIHAVEIVPEVVRLLQQKVTQASDNQDRVIPVFGSFDDVKLPDASLDFAVEFDAFHHSNNLEITLRETARTLKPGGTLLIIDRVHFETLSEALREHLLAIEYSDAFKANHGLAVDTKLTRRDNGEHEIRRSEWLRALADAGFKVETHVLYTRRSLRGLVRLLYSWVPFRLRLKIGKGQQFVRAPVGYILFYLTPFLPGLWRYRYRSLAVTFSGSAAFQAKSVIVATRV